MLKKSYVQAIHSHCRFCKLKMLYMFKTFVPLIFGHASYISTEINVKYLRLVLESGQRTLPHLVL